jgi:hypothetical protein
MVCPKFSALIGGTFFYSVILVEYMAGLVHDFGLTSIPDKWRVH